MAPLRAHTVRLRTWVDGWAVLLTWSSEGSLGLPPAGRWGPWGAALGAEWGERSGLALSGVSTLGSSALSCAAAVATAW